MKRSPVYPAIVVGALFAAAKIQAQIISLSPARTAEGNAGSIPVPIPVYLSAAQTVPVTVNWTTADGTAQAGTDYTAASGTLTFAPGEVYKTISVTVLGDVLHEHTETLRVVLSGPSGSATLGDTEVSVQIHSDERPAFVGLPGTAKIFEKPTPGLESVTGQAMNAVNGSPLSLSLQAGTAIPGSDVRLQTNAIQLDSSQPVIPVIGIDDTLEEPDETFRIVATSTVPEVRVIPSNNTQRFTVGPDLLDLKMSGDLTVVATSINFRIFRKTAGVWALEHTVNTPSGGVQSVDVDNGIVAADFPGEGVRVYHFAGGAWAQQAFLPQTPNPTVRDRRLALSDGVLAISDPSDTGGVSGEVRIHERHEGGRNAWGLTRTIRPDVLRVDFGFSVASWGPLLAVGSPLSSYGCLYRRDPVSRDWLRVMQFSNGSFGTGRICAVSGEMVLFTSSEFTAYSRRNDTGGLSWSTPQSAWSDYNDPVGLDGNLIYTYSRGIPGFYARALSQGGLMSGFFLASPSAWDIVIRGGSAVTTQVNAQAGVDIVFQEGAAIVTTVEDDDSVTVSAGAATVVEGGGAYIPITLSRSLPVPFSVLCTTVDGTAAAGSDYTWTSSWVTFGAGSTSASVFIPTLADGQTEGPETVQIILEFPSLGEAGSAGTVTITDRAPPTVSFPQATYGSPEGSAAAPGVLTLNVSISASAPAGAGFDWTITPGTATAGQDYPNATGSVSIPAGATTASFTIPLTGDDLCEPAESFTVQISNFRSLSAGSLTAATGTIQNDDAGTPQPDSYTTAQNTPLTANVRDNDCSAIPSSVATTVSGGSLNYNSSGQFTYTPLPNFIGTDSFSYNGGGISGGGGSGSVVEFVPSNAIFRWLNPLNDIDPALTFSGWNEGWFTPGWDDAAWGTGSGLMGYGQILSSQGQLNPDTDIGTPVSNARRTAYFRHKFNVSQAGVYNLELSIARDDAAIIYINGTEVQRSHEAGAIQIASAPDRWDLMVEGNSTAFTNGFNEGDPYVYTLTGIPLSAGLNTLAISGHNTLSGSLANSSDLSVRVFYLRGQQSGTLAPPVPVTIQVTDAQIPPVLTADSYTTTEDAVLTTGSPAVPSLYANDGLLNASGTAYDPILEIAVADATGGTVTSINAATGNFAFTPEANFSGPASFRYRVRDKDGWSALTNVSVTIINDLVIQPLARLEPAGSQLFGSTSNYQFTDAAAAIDASVALKAGQTLSLRSLLSAPPPGLLRLETGDGVAVTGGQARPFGVDNIPIPADGNYIIRMGQPGVQLSGTLTLLVNGGLPDFVESGVPYDIAGTTPAVVGRGAVQATLVTDLTHRYTLPATAGMPVQAYVYCSAGAVPFRIEDSAGVSLATSTADPADNRATLLTWTPPASGSYRIAVPGIPGRTYHLQLFRNAVTSDKLAAAGPPVPYTIAGHLSGNGSTEAGTTFAVFGDYGSGNANELAVANMVKSWNPDFLIPVGDHNYSNDWSVGSAVWTQRVGNYYGDYILGRADNRYPEQTSAIQRFFPVPGNHDSGPSTANGGDLSSYLEYLHLNPGGTPRLPAGVHETFKSYYKFTWGNMEFYMIDADNAVVNSALANEQRLWLKEQIAASTAQWKFAAWHQPAYSSSAVHGNHSMMQWGADWTGLTAIFCGHDHIYERLNVGHGVTQFVSGLGGASIYSLGAAKPESVFRYNADYGSMRVTAGSAGVRFEFLAANAPGGTIIDSYTIGTAPGLSAVTGSDTVTLRVQPGRTYRLYTTTPQPPGSLTSTVNPALEVRDHLNATVASDLSSAADARNASLNFTVPLIPDCPPEGCAWTVKVYNETAGSGEYLLHVTEAPGPVDEYNTWAALNLPAGQRAYDADPDFDGAPNLMEFLAQSPPAQRGSAPLSLQPGGDLRIHLPANWETPVLATIEVTSSLASNSWTTVASHDGSGIWTGPGPLPASAPGGGFLVTMPAAAPRFYRLRFQLTP